jgi:hypothetical protein
MLAAAGSFVILHFLMILVDRGTRRDAVPGADIWVRIFNLDFETTAPAWWSAVVLIVTALLALTLSRVDPMPGLRRGWTWTAAVFAFLSLDESAVVHEELSAPLITRLDLDPDRWQLWAWLLPYSVLGLGLCVIAVPFLRRLPAPTRRRFIAGAAFYLTGAAGMELFGRPLFTHGEPTICHRPAPGERSG